MVETPSEDGLDPARREQRMLGQALRRMRENRGLTQAKAAERFDVSTQAWQRYESGERRWTEHKLRRVAEALGGDLEELLQVRAQLDTGGIVGLADRGRPYTAPVAPPTGLINELAGMLGPHADRMRLDTDALSPWAEGGELIVFDRDRPPRRGQGCVVEATDGTLTVHMFDGRDAAGVRVYSLAPRAVQTLAPDAVRGVFAVRFRGD